MDKQKYLEQLSERIADLESLIGERIDEPYTDESISKQVLKCKDKVTECLESLRYEAKALLQEGN